LCEFDSKDPNIHKREKLLEQRKRTLGQHLQTGRDLNIIEAKEYLSVMRSLYEGKSQRDESLKFDLYHPMMMLAEFHFKLGEIEQASETFIEVYNLIKHTREYSALMCLLKAVEIYLIGKMYNKAKETVKLAIDSFIGDKEDIKYTISKKFSKDFLQVIGSI
jgi:ATP/maltotriose-dependent transcriptional regulator MalT